MILKFKWESNFKITGLHSRGEMGSDAVLIIFFLNFEK